MLLSLMLVAGSASALRAATLSIVSLRCEDRANPLGIDSIRPRLGWTLQAHDPAARGLRQSDYQILVSSSPGLLARNKGNLWNSGRIESARTHGITYAGKPLRSDQRCWWKVRVDDQASVPSAWSESAQWTMGVLRAKDWHGANWVGGPASLLGDDNSTLLLRHSFVVQQGLKRAVVNICGLGQYEMTVNGEKPTEDLLTPGWTDYKKTCLYDTYDITANIHQGPNAIGLLLSNGMYRVGGGGRYHKFVGSFGPLQAILLLHLEYNDGRVENVITDSHWQAGVSPMTFSNVYGGEDWDARLVQNGWDRPNFNAAHWLPVQVLSGPGGALKGLTHAAPPIRAYQVFKPISQREIRPNVTVYDLGQTASYMARFTVHGPAGSIIRITPDELLMPDGSLFRNNYNGRAWSQYTLSGQGRESYTAKFYYCGCRYFQVECLPAPGGTVVPHVDSIAGVVVHSSVTPDGKFSCSNALFNKIFRMIRWAEVSNMMSIITDCPNRERLGWLEQDHLHGPSFRYNFDMNPLVTKIISDMSDSQDPDGLIPTTAPEYMVMGGVWRGAIEWGSSGVLLPWQQYQWTGDISVLRRNYPMMKRYVQYLTSTAHDEIAAPGLGDWSGQHASPDTPKPLVATALYYRDAEVVARSAELLGDVQDAATGKKLAQGIRNAFNKTFFDPATNQYGSGSQCSNAMALALGLAAPQNRKAVLSNIVADLQARQYALTVGEVGLEYLFQALAEGGRSDVIYAINNQSDKPGYGDMLKKGATALCETWDDNRDNTQDQFMLGHIMEWFYHNLAGIQLDPKAPGFTHIIIHPAIVGNLTEAEAHYHSIQGEIYSEWHRQAGFVHLDVTIPVNTTATIFIPTIGGGAITESHRPVAQARDVRFIRREPGYAIYAVSSGTYAFSAPFATAAAQSPGHQWPGDTNRSPSGTDESPSVFGTVLGQRCAFNTQVEVLLG